MNRRASARASTERSWASPDSTASSHNDQFALVGRPAGKGAAAKFFDVVPGPSTGAKFGGGFLGSEWIPQEQLDAI